MRRRGRGPLGGEAATARGRSPEARAFFAPREPGDRASSPPHLDPRLRRGSRPDRHRRRPRRAPGRRPTSRVLDHPDGGVDPRRLPRQARPRPRDRRLPEPRGPPHTAGPARARLPPGARANRRRGDRAPDLAAHRLRRTRRRIPAGLHRRTHRRRRHALPRPRRRRGAH